MDYFWEEKFTRHGYDDKNGPIGSSFPGLWQQVGRVQIMLQWNLVLAGWLRLAWYGPEETKSRVASGTRKQ